MKSPFTGGNVVKKVKSETYTFRNEKYMVKRYYFQCEDTGRTFSNAEVDDKAIEDLYSQYRKRHGIPFPVQLKKLREKYGLSARTMSKIAGIGINQYAIYENGEMPTVVIGQRLSSLFDKTSLLKSIESSRARLGKSYGQVKEKVDSYEEPFALPIKVEYYNDFNESRPLMFPSLSISIRRPNWHTATLN